MQRVGMMAEKRTGSKSKEYRVTLYIPPEKQRWQELAVKMKAEGYDGVFDINGKPVKSTIIQHLMAEKLGID